MVLTNDRDNDRGLDDERERERRRRDRDRQSRLSNDRSNNDRDRSPRGKKKSVRVFISNIPYEYRWQELKDLFRENVGCEETPIKGVRSFTPGQCDTPVTPHRYSDTDMVEAYKTPARLVPIQESPDREVHLCSNMETPAGPSKPRICDVPDTPPASVYPPESPVPSGYETSSKTPFIRKLPEDRVTSKTPFTLKLHEEGICAIPDTPMIEQRSTIDRFVTPSTSKARTTDTPSLGSIINRPKISKPVKSAPFTIFTDED